MLDNFLLILFGFAGALGLTLILEVPFVRVLGMKGDTLKAFVLANIVSNLLLNSLIPFGLPIVMGEFLVVAFEYLAVMYAVGSGNKIKTFLIVLGANVVSALFSILLLFLI